MTSTEALMRRLDELPWSEHDSHVALLGELREQVEGPDAPEWPELVEVLDAICQHLRGLGRFDEAIAARRESIAAGYESTPDPEADIAEMLVEQGRLDEGAALFAKLLEAAPGDIWLYNSAAWAYLRGDPEVALDWALRGIDLAIQSGDPEALAGQLHDFAQEALGRLGRPRDEQLERRVDWFVEKWQSSPAATAGVDMARKVRERLDDLSDSERLDLLADTGRSMVMTWFPAEEWAEARRLWPEIDDGCSGDHRRYTQRIEGKVKAMSRTVRGHDNYISPMTVAEVVEFAESVGAPVESLRVRSRLASSKAADGRAIDWPPKRNDRCWCASGRKYKQCCGPVPRLDGSPRVSTSDGDDD